MKALGADLVAFLNAKPGGSQYLRDTMLRHQTAHSNPRHKLKSEFDIVSAMAEFKEIQQKAHDRKLHVRVGRLLKKCFG